MAYESTSRTYFGQNPFGSAVSDLGNQAAGQYMNFLNNPIASPLYQGQLSGLLASLQPQETAARGALTDQYRAAGGLRSGAYGVAGANLEGNLMRNKQVMASQLLGQMFPQMVQALQWPMGNQTSLLGALRLSEANSQGQQAPSGGDPWGPRDMSLPTMPSYERGGSSFGSGQAMAPQSGFGPQLAQPAPQPADPWTPYMSPLSGGAAGGAITFNPLTGSYESTSQPVQGDYGYSTGLDPFQHTYTDMGYAPDASEGWW